jgi:hypothetical protein
MPTKRIEAVALPFAGKRHVADTSRLASLYMGMGQQMADLALQRGQITQRGLERLGDLFSGYSERKQAEKASVAAGMQRQREREDERAFTAEQNYQDRKSRENERFAEQAIRGEERKAEASTRKLEREEAAVAKAIDDAPRGIVDLSGNRALFDAAQRFPAQAARFVKQDGLDVLPMTGGEKQAYERAKAADAARVADDKRADLQFEEAKRHNRATESIAGQRPSASEPLVQVVGPDGKAMYVPRSEAIGKQPPSGSQKPATGLEKRALNFFNRAEQADKDLEVLEGKIQQYGLLEQGRLQYFPNWAQTEEGQLYRQAQRAFTEARLRKDSGAAIPEQEFDNDRKTYFAQPGDSKATLEQKRRARGAILASLGFESGQALGEFLGDADEARRVVETYRQRSASPAGPAKPTILKIEPVKP